jgi:hypothetical protein
MNKKEFLLIQQRILKAKYDTEVAYTFNQDLRIQASITRAQLKEVACMLQEIEDTKQGVE